MRDLRTVVVCDQATDDLVEAADCGSDAVFCEQEFLGESEPLRSLLRALAQGLPYRSPLIQAALQTNREEATLGLGHPPSSLTDREQDLIALWVKGFGDREAAERLGVTYATVRGYGRSLRQKLGVCSCAQAVLQAVALGQGGTPLSRRSGKRRIRSPQLRGFQCGACIAAPACHGSSIGAVSRRDSA